MVNKDVFENMPVSKAVATLAMPTILSMLVTVFYNMADTFFVGQTGDANQVAAVSLAMPIFLLIMAVGSIFGVGGSSYISRSLGEEKYGEVQKATAFCFYMGILSAIVVTGVLFIAIDPILTIIGADINTFNFAKKYLLYFAAGSIFIVISTAFGSIIRSEGAAKVSMKGMMLGTILNIILDPVMILWLDMGVTGAAIATVIGNIATVIYYCIYLKNDKTMLSISIHHLKITKRIVKNILMIGIPASLNNVLMSCSNIVFNMTLVKYGNDPVAGMGVAMKACMLVVFVQMGLAMGIQPLIGYCFGSKNIKRLNSVMKFSVMCNVIIGVVLTIIYYLSSDFIISAFISDENVIMYGIQMLKVLMISGPYIGILFVLSFSFQAMGKGIESLILSVSRQGFVFIPTVLIANRLFGLKGLLYAQPVSDFISLFMALSMFIYVIGKAKKNHEMGM